MKEAVGQAEIQITATAQVEPMCKVLVSEKQVSELCMLVLQVAQHAPMQGHDMWLHRCCVPHMGALESDQGMSSQAVCEQ